MADLISLGTIKAARKTLTRPADTTAYAVGDAMANSTTAASVLPLDFEVSRRAGGFGKIIGARLFTDSASAFGAMRLHLFNREPFAAAGYQADNAALAITFAAMHAGNADSPSGVGGTANKLPYIDFTTFTAQSSSAECVGVCQQTEFEFVCAPGSVYIYGILEARAAFTPASGQQFTVVLSVQGMN